MDRLFITILNMSLTGIFVIVTICLARMLIKKSPKIISYGFWVAAGIRLIFPVSIDSAWCLIPFGAQPIPIDISIVGPIWLAGAVAMLAYGVTSYFVLKYKLRKSVHQQGNIYEGKDIKSPFVLGFFSPKIYLPQSLSRQEREHVILHEQIHIQRHDHIIKFIAFIILCLHWFNPFVWLAFKLMGRDMEMSCDERVLSEMGIEETKEGYSMSLVSLATEKKIVTGSPLAFGEGDIKERVKNVLNFKKSSKLVSMMVIMLVTMLSVGLMMNPVGATTLEDFNEETIISGVLQRNEHVLIFTCCADCRGR